MGGLLGKLANAYGKVVGTRHITGEIVLDEPQPTPNMSASSYDTFNDCPRKWWFAKVARLDAPKSQSLTTGIAVHDYLENYLTDGTPIPDTTHGKIAKAGVHHLPQPGSVSVEQWVAGECGPLPFKGKVDFFTKSPSGVWYPDGRAMPGNILAVGDHKTSSNPRRYGKSAQELATHHQMLGYAYLLGKDDPPDVLHLTHVYYATRGNPSSFRVDTAASWDSALTVWETYTKTAEQMNELVTVLDSEAVRPNAQSCRKYGGCQYAHMCTVPGQRHHVKAAQLPQGAKTMADLTAAQRRVREKLKLRRAQAVTPPDAAPLANPTDALFSECVAGTKALHAGLGDELTDDVIRNLLSRKGLDIARLSDVKVAAGLQVAPVTPTPEPEPVAEAKPEPVVVEPSMNPIATINESDNTPKYKAPLKALVLELSREGQVNIDDMPPLLRGPLKMQRLRKPRIMGVLKAGESLGLWSIEGDAIVPSGDAPAPEPERPDNGPEGDDVRRPEPTPAPAPAPAPEPTPAPAPAPAPKPTPAPAPAPAPEPLMVKPLLFVDCYVPHAGIPDFSEVLRPIESELELKEGIDYIYSKDFRKGEKAVASMLMAKLTTGELTIDRDYLVDSTHLAWKEVQAVLQRWGKVRFVRSLR